ncbi:MAG: DUF1854 domain-containing protein [Armatimonadetes bacterium]|nr:DUF1854 domain-containing protein [Armatimonadota bacterium]
MTIVAPKPSPEDRLNLFYEPEGRLRLTAGNASYLQVKPVWASPLSFPGKFLALVDGKDQEIVMLTEGLQTLEAESRAIVEQELHKRYLNARVVSIDAVKTEFGITYWSVQTDRGPRELVTQSLQENANWMSTNVLMLNDVDGNKYEIQVDTLDERSRRFVDMTV